MNKLNTYIILVSLIIFTSCGFKVENKSNLSNFGISELKIEGDRRINYKIKSGLSFKTAKNSQKLLDLVIKSTKTKTIKEKNIKNEITKYKIDISVLVILTKWVLHQKNLLQYLGPHFMMLQHNTLKH